MRATPLLFALLCAGAPAAHAQHTMPAADSTAADSAVPLYDNLGDYSRRITTLSPEAHETVAEAEDFLRALERLS